MRRFPALVLLGAVLLFVVPSSVKYYSDWLWFRELGYEGIFLRTLNTELMVFAATFGVVFVALFLNLHLARRTMKGSRITFGTGVDGRPIALDAGPVSDLATPAAAVAAFGFAIAESDDIQAMGKWSLAWNDLLPMDVRPALDDQGMGAVLTSAQS